MHKKVLLFVVGLLLAVGAFFIYQWLTGWTFMKGQRPALVLTTQDSKGVTYEQWTKDGKAIEYELKAEGFSQARDADGKLIPGQYVLVQPRVTYYMGKRDIIYMRADSGTLRADTVGGGTPGGMAGGLSSQKMSPRGGRLHGNVMIAFGPRDSFGEWTGDWKLERMGEGQTLIKFEKDIEFNWLDRIVQSPGAVQVRSDRVAFDGAGLTFAFSPEQRVLQYLRIDKGDKIIVKQAVKGFGGLLSPASAGSAPAGSAPAPQPAATEVAAETPANPNAATRPDAPPTYRIQFGRDVQAQVGTFSLSSENLYLLAKVAMGNFDRSPGPEPTATRAAAPVIDPTPVATTIEKPKPAKLGPLVSEVFARRPQDQVGPEDLVVTWVGSMEMRPAEAGTLQLTDARDVALEAVGIAGKPVVVRDGPNTGKAGRVWYHQGSRRVELESGTNEQVAFDHPQLGRVTCMGVTFWQDALKLRLLGPARAEITNAGFQPQGEQPAADKADKKEPVIATWGKSLDMQLEVVDDPKSPGKKITAVRQAVLVGQVGIGNSTFAITGNSLDVLIANTGDKKSPQVLEKLVATGPVTVLSARPGSTIADADHPVGMSAQSLEVLTQLAGKVPVLSRINMNGDVVAWTYSQSTADGGKKQLNRQLIRTPRMEVDLAPRQKTNTEVAAAFGEADIKEMRAYDGVKLELDGYGPQQIVATAHTLIADAQNGKAVLEGVVQPNGVVRFARFTQGENQIAGTKIMLNQDGPRLEVPGNGDFIFVQPAQRAGDQPSPVQVTWSRSMVYDGKSLRADIEGGVKARLLGREDQESELRADQLAVLLQQEAAKPNERNARISLKQIVATKDVVATGATFDVNKKPITRVYMKAGKLAYTEATRSLEIPMAGTMLVEDYRDPPAGAEAGNEARGQTAFSWGESLVYAGDTGSITFKKDVRMIHVPTKPLRVANDAGAKNQGEFAQINRIELNTQRLVATMLQSKDKGGGETVASPVALGSGGNQKLAKVVADNGAALSVDKTDLAGTSIEYDALAQTATASGSREAPATINGEAVRGVVSADRVFYNIAKREATFDNIRGTVTTPE